MGRITVFSLSTCPHCKKAKSMLTDHDLPFTDISLSEYPEKRNDMLKAADRLTVPQIFFNDKHIGGNAELEALFSSGEIKKYVALLQQDGPHNPLLARPTYEPQKSNDPQPLPLEEDLICVGGECLSYEQMMDFLRKHLEIKDRKHHLKTYNKCFLGKDLVTLLQDEYKLQSREEAVQIGESLRVSRLFGHVNHGHQFVDTDIFYRLLPDFQPLVLNSNKIWKDRIDDPMVTLSAATNTISNIVSTHRDMADGLVDYVAVSQDSRFPLFESAVCELQKTALEEMGELCRTAFVINLYNMMILHAFSRAGPPQSSLQRISFFDQIKYNVGGKLFSLNDLENGILRGNKAPPYQLTVPFKSKDPRLKCALTQGDRRVHFALNCGAKSCPPVKMFTAATVNEELRIVAMAFMEQTENCRIDMVGRTLWLSKILSWYRADFGKSNLEVATSVLEYLRGAKKAQLEELVKGQFNIRHVQYDWSHDGKPAKKRDLDRTCSVM
mmetsp:Transcript_39607/g.77937  ORF Transcript_39607/g.77937 Transcript_39607/m.77937 type:complete len:496 (+) Transcript_39607:98-1585(+)